MVLRRLTFLRNKEALFEAGIGQAMMKRTVYMGGQSGLIRTVQAQSFLLSPLTWLRDPCYPIDTYVYPLP